METKWLPRHVNKPVALLRAQIKRLVCTRKKGESKMNDEKPIRVQRVELIDKQGRTRAVFGAENGVPYMAHYDGKGRILSWLTFLVDGTPDVRVFNGPEPEPAVTEQATTERI